MSQQATELATTSTPGAAFGSPGGFVAFVFRLACPPEIVFSLAVDRGGQEDE